MAHDLSKAKALSNALVVMCGELPACAESCCPAQSQTSLKCCASGEILATCAPVWHLCTGMLRYASDQERESAVLRMAAKMHAVRCAAVPWSLCAVIFSGLYLTYSRDKAAAQLKEAAAEQRGRLVQRNGFLRLEEDGDAEEKGGFDQKWQLLRTTPAQR